MCWKQPKFLHDFLRKNDPSFYVIFFNLYGNRWIMKKFQNACLIIVSIHSSLFFSWIQEKFILKMSNFNENFYDESNYSTSRQLHSLNLIAVVNCFLNKAAEYLYRNNLPVTYGNLILKYANKKHWIHFRDKGANEWRLKFASNVGKLFFKFLWNGSLAMPTPYYFIIPKILFGRS